MYKTYFMMMDNNSVKRFKQSKDCENSLGKNEQEVLVLPPNLLQELGINLGNIQNTSYYPVVKDNFEPNNLQSGEKSKINSEQLHDVAKEVTGLGSEKLVQLSPPILSSNDIPKQKQEYIIPNNDVSTSNIDQNTININLEQNTKVIEKKTYIQIQSSAENNSDIKYQKKSNVCNNKQSIEIVEFNSLNPQSSHLNSNNGKKSKINIISHEVVKHVSDETFKTLKICPAPRNAFIPFKINTPIERIPKSTSIFDNVTSDKTENSISMEPQLDSKEMLKTDDLAYSMHTEENDVTKNNFKNYPDIDAANGLVPNTDKKPEAKDVTEVYCVIDEVDNIREESNLATCTENKTVDIDMSDEMPTSSTSVVSQMSDNTLTDVYKIEIEEVDDEEICTEKNNNISENLHESNNSASDKQSMDVSWRDSVIKKADYMNESLLEKIKLSSHHLTTKSKLCIQGVEKPGGRIEGERLQTDMILRTYLNRQARNEFNSKPGEVILNNELTAKTYEIVDKCTDFNNIDVTCVTKQVSPCNEFGRLHFDDDESECVYFHFLPKNTVQIASSSFETFSEKNASNEETFTKDDTYGNDVQINLSDVCCSELSSISKNDISDQFNEDQTLFSSETYVNLYDEIINDDIKSDDLYSFSTEVKEEIFDDDDLLDQSDPEEQELFIKETRRNEYRRISTAEEVGETSEAYTKKRKRTSNQEEEGILLHSIEANYNGLKNISCVKCAVCRKVIAEVDWDSHLYEEHCYIAWKEGSSIIDLCDDELNKKLSETLEKLKSVYCTFCGQKGRNLNRMLAHFKKCITKIFIDTNSNENVNTKIKSELIKCGVCKMEISSNNWNDHIQKEHNYLAWKDGDPELNLDDGWKIQIHLQNILNDIGRLVCGKCDLVRHFTKSFIKHIKKCDGSRINHSVGDSLCVKCVKYRKHGKTYMKHIKECDDSKKRKRTITEDEGTSLQSTEAYNRNVPVAKKISSCVKCAVCGKEVPEVDWNSHLYENHCHIGWKKGSSIINLDDKELIQKLSKTLTEDCGLYCTFCGQKVRDLKKFLSHLKICITKIFTNVNVTNSSDAKDVKIENVGTVKCDICVENVPVVDWTEHIDIRHVDIKPSIDVLPDATENVIKIEHDDEKEIISELVKCGVCKMEMSSNNWNDHIQKEHNYLAWKDGDPELDLNDENQIYMCLLNVVDRTGGLVCGKCTLVRQYPKSFMKHISKCKGNIVNKCQNDSVVVDSSDDVNQTQEDDISLILSDSVECGVCSQKVAGTEWLDHIHKEHNYLAKIRGVPPLDLSNDDAVKKHLQGIRSITGRLTCAKCGMKRKIIKNFMEHIKECHSTTKKMNVSTKNIEAQLDNSICETVRLEYSGTVQCGVCREQVDGAQWLQHIQKEHNYIAWLQEEQPLNFDSEEESWQYLNNVARKAGVLICGKCGLYRKYGKAYMQHVKECDGSKAALIDQLNVSQMMENDINSTYLDDCINYRDKVKCGVCAAELAGARWLQHIQEEHNYIAWVEGRTPLYPEDKEFINTYLKLLIKHTGALICAKCGLPRKLAKFYLQHVSKCGETKEEAVPGSPDNVEQGENEFVHSAAVQCGACLQQVAGSQWILHIRLKHDYLARVAGLPPLDVDDEEQVRKHLSALRKYVDQLICSNCGEGHKSVRAFLKHLQQCDGAEISDSGSDMEVEEESFVPNGTVRCGVCGREVRGEEWINHIHKEHDYMATIEGKPPLILDDEEEIRTHLNTVRRYVRELVCNKCGESRKFVKSYMKHIKNCAVSERVSTDTRVGSGRDSVASVATEEDKEYQVEFPGTVVCGVCHREVYGNQWVHHIRTEHNYIAHVKGKIPLDINNNKQIKAHLNAVSKYAGGLYCNKCGLMRLYVKSYLAHVQQCRNSNSPFTVDANNSVTKKESDETFIPNYTTKVREEVSTKANNIEASQFVYEGNAICGVCRSEVARKEWINHIQKQHNYLAWAEGETPLDLENQEQVHAHLYELSRLQNGLTCNICDAKRKYVKSFLDHIRNCSDIIQGGIVECAVCSKSMPVEEWKNHAMKTHYNIAWTVGSDPIDLKNPYAVEKYLKEYKKIEKNLICKICKLTRVSCAGFYAHIITCGKTDEEIENFKSVCDICNSKYLCIYKNQHLAFHREQEHLKEKKSRALELTHSKAEEGGTPGRRRAAEKAKNVIEDYKSKLKHKCGSCSFGTDVEEELEGHVCAADALSDSDSSLQFAHSDTDSDVDSNLSMEEEQAIDKKKRIDTPPKVSHHIPFKLKSSSNYIAQAALDFHDMHYTLDELFPDWKPKGRQEVDTEDLPKYLPTVEESCKVKIGNEEWTTYKRFEAKYNTVISMFVGGSIRCVSWAAARGGAARGAAAERSYLAVAGPGAPDAPRLPADQLREHPALIQLWDFGEFQSEPKFVLGLALDYGTVWAMEWCPSGARDCPPHCAAAEDEAGAGSEAEAEADHTAEARLGLLALACSNGSVYILSVPHPNHTAKNPQIIKIKPSVELRLCSREDRKKYQATAISWSKQKGHKIILVGYADGSTAFYDLGCDSPLLKSVENDITILYPFQDDRPHNTCISDVDLFASGVAEGEGGGGGGAWGAWGGASCTGVHAALRAAAPRLHAPLATAATRFTPHWPSLLVTADEAIANYMTNELEWHGGGRRLGGQRALAACARCGTAAALTPPALRLTRTHPAYRDPRRDVVGMLHMVSLAKKRSKHINDELSMKIEPLTYEDAVKEYGIELKLKSQMTKADQQVVVSEAKAQFPERFPLADVPALAFCPAPAAHARLALPTHAGLLFILTV